MESAPWRETARGWEPSKRLAVPRPPAGTSEGPAPSHGSRVRRSGDGGSLCDVAERVRGAPELEDEKRLAGRGVVTSRNREVQLCRE